MELGVLQCLYTAMYTSVFSLMLFCFVSTNICMHMFIYDHEQRTTPHHDGCKYSFLSFFFLLLTY
jgi:hypothetical protein